MAMNKSEKAEFEKLQNDLRLAKALRWTEPVDYDVEIPRQGLVKGFLYNEYSPRVEPACTTFIHHAFGRDDQTTTQNPHRLYSTQLRALKALRHALEIRFAKELANVDRQIEEESK